MRVHLMKVNGGINSFRKFSIKIFRKQVDRFVLLDVILRCILKILTIISLWMGPSANQQN